MLEGHSVGVVHAADDSYGFVFFCELLRGVGDDGVTRLVSHPCVPQSQ